MVFLKTFKDAKFVVHGNTFQTFITLSTKNFCLMLAVHLGLNSLYLWPIVLVLVLSAKKSSKFTFTFTFTWLDRRPTRVNWISDCMVVDLQGGPKTCHVVAEIRFILSWTVPKIWCVEKCSAKFEVDMTIHCRVFVTWPCDLDLWPFDLEHMSYMGSQVTNPATKYEDPMPIRSWVMSYNVSRWLPLKMRMRLLRMRPITWPVSRVKNN